MTGVGKKNSTAATGTEIRSPAYRLTPIQRLMLLVSPLPQYWLARTERPLSRPRMMIWII